jgi:hypothetical protein
LPAAAAAAAAAGDAGPPAAAAAKQPALARAQLLLAHLPLELQLLPAEPLPKQLGGLLLPLGSQQAWAGLPGPPQPQHQLGEVLLPHPQQTLPVQLL